MNTWPEDVAAALRSSDVVAITSGITDLREAAELLDTNAEGRWQRIEWGMGSAVNRARFHDLQQSSGFHMLPMFIAREGVIGGLPELRRYLAGPASGRGTSTSPGQAAKPERLSSILGYAGFTPFPLLAAAAWFPQPGWQDFALHALSVYGAVILSFLGAVHWGLFLSDRGHRAAGLPAPAWAVIPPVAAWAALLLPQPVTLLLLALLFPLVLVVDRSSLRTVVLPPHYIAMRGNLTLGATLTLIVGALASVGMA